METFLRSISIRHRLLGGMLVVSVLIMALGIWATISYKGLQSQTDVLLDAQASVSRDTGAILAAFDRIQRHEQSVLLNSNNAVEAAEHKTRWDKEVASTTALLTAKTEDAERAKHLAEGAAGLAAYAKELAPVLQQVVEAKLDNTAGFAAQTVASAVLMTTAYAYAAPVSTTHVTTSAVMGVGATRKFSAVRWGVAGNILVAWVLTLPAAGLTAAAVFKVVHLFVG